MAQQVQVRAEPVRPNRTVGWILLFGGLIGVVASFVLTVDKIHLLQDPSYVPGCTINAEFSCGTVMTSWQAELLGFPNSLIGLLTFPVVILIGVLVLARVGIPRPIWWVFQFGTLAAAVFVSWLQVQSLYEIGALCLYCMAVWAATIPIFCYVTLTTIRSDQDLTEDRSDAVVLPRWLPLLPVVWLAVIGLLVTLRFA